MTSKQVRLRRSTAWYAHRGIVIGRKVAWRVLGFASPKAYREWRAERIRIEGSVRYDRRGLLIWRNVVTTKRWHEAQPRQWRADNSPDGET